MGFSFDFQESNFFRRNELLKTTRRARRADGTGRQIVYVFSTTIVSITLSLQDYGRQVYGVRRAISSENSTDLKRLFAKK